MNNQYNQMFRVSTTGFSVTYTTFFNPITKETFEHKTWDIDDPRVECDPYVRELMTLPWADEVVEQAYYHHRGIIRCGDTVRVVKGRKVPIGTVGVVKEIYTWHDQYGRPHTTYVVFPNGVRTSITNCELVD